MLRILVTYLSRPVSRLLQRTLPANDPWKRFASPVPLGVYGLGARRDFRWYFEGESAVEVQTIEQVLDWLLDCTYASDPDLFHEADFWQHPCTFEQLKRGDCEDFALWAWRKLVRLGFDAEFVAGRSALPGSCEAGHTWLLFRREGRAYLFDPIIREREHMIRPLHEVRHEYIPEVSVDRHFNRFVYAGYYLKWRGEKAWPKRHASLVMAQAG